MKNKFAANTQMILDDIYVDKTHCKINTCTTHTVAQFEYIFIIFDNFDNYHKYKYIILLIISYYYYLFHIIIFFNRLSLSVSNILNTLTHTHTYTYI